MELHRRKELWRTCDSPDQEIHLFPAQIVICAFVESLKINESCEHSINDHY